MRELGKEYKSRSAATGSCGVLTILHLPDQGVMAEKHRSEVYWGTSCLPRSVKHQSANAIFDCHYENLKVSNRPTSSEAKGKCARVTKTTSLLCVHRTSLFSFVFVVTR
jgi:hypothetical protein